MNKPQIDFIASLDPDNLDGSVQSILQRNDLSMCRYEATLEFLIKCLKADKDSLYRDYLLLTKACREHNIDLNTVLELK